MLLIKIISVTARKAIQYIVNIGLGNALLSE